MKLQLNAPSLGDPMFGRKLTTQMDYLGRNVRQPNHVLVHSLAGFEAQRRPRAGEERLAGTKHDRVQVDAILINKAEVRHASRQVRACNVNLSDKLSLEAAYHPLDVILDERGIGADRVQ